MELEGDELDIIKYLKLKNTTRADGAVHIESVVRFLGYRHDQRDYVLKAVKSLIGSGFVKYEDEYLTIIKE